MTTNNQLVRLNLPPEVVTKDTIIALFNTAKIRMNYVKILDGINNLEVTETTLKETYEEFKASDKFEKEIEKWRKEQAAAYAGVAQMFLDVQKEVLKPILEATQAKKAQVKTVSAANADKIAKARAEQEKNNSISSSIVQFINQITLQISTATTDDHIVTIQKRIGSEKARTGYYEGSFIDELRAKCDALAPIINEQKLKIRKIEELNNQMSQNMAGGNEQAASEIREAIELEQMLLQENGIRLQEKAFEEVITMQQVEVGHPEINVTKQRTSRWKWRVDDLQLLAKKLPNLVKLVPDEEAIEALMAEQRPNWIADKKEAVPMTGITFYKEKYL